MNIAIVGSSGYIAGYIIKELQNNNNIKQIIKIDQNQEADYFLDLLQADKFPYDVLEGIDYIIFTAAISGPDQCAKEFDLCWKINVEGTKYFIQEALKRKCRVLFFSSDAVFGDISGKIYTEESETNAATPYGKMKKTIEDEFKDVQGFKAIRLSYVVSKNDKFISYCFACQNKDENIEVFHPFYRNCVVVSDVVKVVMWMSIHWEEYPYFVLNVAGQELVSRVRIVDEINRIIQRKINYKIVTPNSKFYQNRPAITQMKSLYLEKYEIVENKSFTEKIQEEMEK